ncbi:MAG: VTC domain-containing protein [Planctomycetota bacterium]|jgi:hypothetical protein
MLKDLLRHIPGRKTGSYELLKGSTRQKTGSSHPKSDVRIAKEPGKLRNDVFRWRQELKYRISEPKAEAVAQFIKSYLHPDRYCKLRRGGRYPIVSLYLDSNDLLLCRESLTGQKNRYKLRVRSYTDEPDYPCFLEIKRRMNTTILKSRARVMHNDVATLLSGISLPPQNYSADDEEALRQFRLYMDSINAGPVILIRYMRQAYEGDSDNRVRVTFDRELCYKVTTAPKVALNGQGWQHNSISLCGVILEIKFTGAYPAWISQMAKYLDLRQQPISKYVTSVEESCALGFCAPLLRG